MGKYHITGDIYSNTYIDFDISPDFGEGVSSGETITISGEIYNNTFSSTMIVFRFGTYDTFQSYISKIFFYYGFSLNVSRGRKTSFSFNIPVSSVDPALIQNRGTEIYAEIEVLNDSASRSEAFHPNHPYIYLDSRLNPVITGVTFTDINQLESLFGNYVQGESNFIAVANVDTDELDSGLTWTAHVTMDGFSAEFDGDHPHIGSIDLGGTHTWSVVVTDSAGGVSEPYTGSMTLLPYQAPVLGVLSGVDAAARYTKSPGESPGEIIRERSDDGPLVWYSVEGNVSPLNGYNAYTLTCIYREYGSTNWSDPITIATGADGESLTLVNAYNEDTELITFSASTRYEMLITLVDNLHAVQIYAGVDKAGGYMNVEKYGVAIGMRSTATREHKKFEVSPEYEIHFYGGGSGGDYSTTEQDTGAKWIDGSPIYRRVIELGAAISGGGSREIDLECTVGALIRVGGYGVAGGSNAYMYPIPYTNTTAANQVRMYLNPAHQYLIVSCGSGVSLQAGAVAIVEYTKLVTGRLKDVNGNVLIDSDGNEIALGDDYTSVYTGSQIDTFVGEVI